MRPTPWSFPDRALVSEHGQRRGKRQGKWCGQNCSANQKDKDAFIGGSATVQARLRVPGTAPPRLLHDTPPQPSCNASMADGPCPKVRTPTRLFNSSVAFNKKRQLSLRLGHATVPPRRGGSHTSHYLRASLGRPRYRFWAKTRVR